MKTKELIAKLKELDPKEEMPVFIAGYGDGDISEIYIQTREEVNLPPCILIED